MALHSNEQNMNFLGSTMKIWTDESFSLYTVSFLRYLNPLTAKFLQQFSTIFIFISISHELLTNVPSNHIYPSSTLNKEYFT